MLLSVYFHRAFQDYFGTIDGEIVTWGNTTEQVSRFLAEQARVELEARQKDPTSYALRLEDRRTHAAKDAPMVAEGMIISAQDAEAPPPPIRITTRRNDTGYVLYVLTGIYQAAALARGIPQSGWACQHMEQYSRRAPVNAGVYYVTTDPQLAHRTAQALGLEISQ